MSKNFGNSKAFSNKYSFNKFNVGHLVHAKKAQDELHGWISAVLRIAESVKWIQSCTTLQYTSILSSHEKQWEHLSFVDVSKWIIRTNLAFLKYTESAFPHANLLPGVTGMVSLEFVQTNGYIRSPTQINSTCRVYVMQVKTVCHIYSYPYITKYPTCIKYCNIFLSSCLLNDVFPGNSMGFPNALRMHSPRFPLRCLALGASSKSTMVLSAWNLKTIPMQVKQETNATNKNWDKQCYILVGGFNPFEKYESTWESFPQGSGWK